MFDTGSADVWVISKSCSWRYIPCIFHTDKYNHNKSISYQAVDDDIVLPYAQGNVSIYLSQDNMEVFFVLLTHFNVKIDGKFTCEKSNFW